MASNFPKLNNNLKSILYNRWVLYFITFLAIADFIFLCNISDWFSASVFVITGVLVTFFNKNMIVVFSIAMVITHILKYGIQGSRLEGFESSEENDLTNTVGEESKVADEEKPIIDKKAEKEAKQSKLKQFMELKKELPEFKEVQKEIVDSVAKINPLIKKAENFIEKFQAYQNK
jgi:hypothetical protein